MVLDKKTIANIKQVKEGMMRSHAFIYKKY